jgi:hypothetical protein
MLTGADAAGERSGACALSPAEDHRDGGTARELRAPVMALTDDRKRPSAFVAAGDLAQPAMRVA